MKVFFTSLLIAALIGSSSLAETTCSQPDDVERLKCYDDASGYGRNYQQKLEDFKRNGYDIHYCVAALQVFYKGSPKLIAYEGMYGPIFEDTVLALSTLIGEMHSFQASELKKIRPRRCRTCCGRNLRHWSR